MMCMHGYSYKSSCEKIEHKRAMKMSIRLYSKPVSSLPATEKTGNGAVATNKAHRAVQCVVDEQRSQQPSSKRGKCMYTTLQGVPRSESILPKMHFR